MISSGLGKVYLVGAGPGDPKLLTLRGLECLQRAEVVVYDRLVDPALLLYVPPEAECIYAGKARGHHTLPQAEINALLIARARQGKRVVRLKGGDPFVFGRGGEEAEALAAAGIPFEVVPGISSAIAVPAAAGIPVTHRGLASSFTVVSGHEDTEQVTLAIDWAALARSGGTLVFLMGMTNLPEIAAQLVRHGRAPQTPVALVRWGTWPEQEALTGTLTDIADRAAARGFGPPAVIIVGEVVALRERLNRIEALPLFGRRIVIPYAEPLPAGLVTALEDAGARVLAVALAGTASSPGHTVASGCACVTTCVTNGWPAPYAHRLPDVLERYAQVILLLPAPSAVRALVEILGPSRSIPARIPVMCLGQESVEEAGRAGLRVHRCIAHEADLIEALSTGTPPHASLAHAPCSEHAPLDHKMNKEEEANAE